jgi:signal transduction histidine kinase
VDGHSQTPPGAGGAEHASPLGRLWQRLVAPSPLLDDVTDQLRARLLAALLVVVVPVGFLSGLVQLALVPGFLPTFLVMSAALGVLALGYLASRTRHYRVGGAFASLAPIAACLVVAALNPGDRVWYAFMSLSVLLGAVFLSLRATGMVAALGLGGILLLLWLVPGLRAPERALPPLVFYSMISLLLLLAARHRNQLEAERRRALLEAQAAVAESQRLEAVSRFAGGVAHDFNNLLGVIFGNLAALRGRGGGGEELEDVQNAADRSAALVRQLLAFSRRQALEPRPLSPGDVLGGLDGILRHLAGSNVHLVVDRPAVLGSVLADPSQLEQVFLNLIVNARDAMPRGGTLRVALHDAVVSAHAPEAVEGVAPGSYVAVEVSDTGTGMTPEVRRRIFEPFFTTKTAAGGTGIGLATVHGIVKQSGGHITVRTAPGRGSTFTVFLPRADEAAVAATPSAPTGP